MQCGSNPSLGQAIIPTTSSFHRECVLPSSSNPSLGQAIIPTSSSPMAAASWTGSNPSLGQAIIPTSQFTINALQIVLVPIPHSGKRSFRPPRSQCPRPDYLLVPIPHSGKRSFRPSAHALEWEAQSQFQSLTRASDHSDHELRAYGQRRVLFQSLTRASDHSDSRALMLISSQAAVPIPHSGKRSFRHDLLAINGLLGTFPDVVEFQSLTRASDHSDLAEEDFACHPVWFESLTRASDHSDCCSSGQSR